MLVERNIPIEKILLDPNNYRFQELGDYVAVPKQKYTSPAVQKKTLDALKKFQLSELKNSIQENGFIQVDRIVVEPFEDDMFVVIEGNRRIAALKLLQADIEGDLIDDDALELLLKAIPCVVAQEKENELFKLTLMGIRHVGGVNEWGGYQRAKLVADLRDRMGLDAGDVASKTGLSVQEVNRRYRAYKALDQMKQHEEFEDEALPSLYPIFHEAISQPIVREWLSWNAETSEFENETDLEFFYQLVTPGDEEIGHQSEPKVRTYSDVRALKQVLMNDEAKAVLYDEEQSFMSAVLVAKRKEISGKWRKESSEASSSLRNIGALDLAEFDSKDIQILTNLRDAADALIKQFEKITSK